MTDLPELPARHKQQEASFGLLFRKWLRKHARDFPPACTFELKHSRGEQSLPFDALSEDQIAYNGKIRGDGELVRVQGTIGEPDYIWLRGVPTFIVVRYPRCFVVLSIYDFVWERNMGKRKSLTESRAREIAQEIVEL